MARAPGRRHRRVLVRSGQPKLGIRTTQMQVVTRALATVLVLGVVGLPVLLRHERKPQRRLGHAVSRLGNRLELAPKPHDPGIGHQHRHPGRTFVLGGAGSCADKIRDEHAHQQPIAGLVERKFLLEGGGLTKGEDLGVAVADANDVGVIPFPWIFLLVFERHSWHGGSFFFSRRIGKCETGIQAGESHGTQLVQHQQIGVRSGGLGQGSMNFVVHKQSFADAF